MQQDEDLLVFHPLAAHVIPHVSYGNTPMPQTLALTVNNIFVQNVHAAVGPTTYSATCSSKACRAKRTASAMASWVILPRHSSMMVSHAKPAATWSSTSATRMRVPRKVGFPWQMSGSATM